MKEHLIDLVTLTTHGQVATEIRNNMFWMTSTRAIPKRFDRGLQIHSYVALPGRYKLPLRIDMEIKIDAPALYLLLGNGRIHFGTHWSDNRVIDDICEPQAKPRFFNTHVLMNEFTKISLIYDLNKLQILVNGEERYYSAKERYMKSSLFEQMNAEGFPLAIACDKRTELTIKSIKIIEYDGSADIVHVPVDKSEIPICQSGNIYADKPTFESCISNLPKELKDEIINLDEWLRKLKPMKFKRQIEKHGNKITYLASDYGFSYAIHPSYDVLYHTLQWYILTGSKPEFWHRKTDHMEETLCFFAKTDPAFADCMFYNLDDCVGCGASCKVKTTYSLGDRQTVACHGKMHLKMCVSDFQDVRKFIGAANELSQKHEAESTDRAE